MAQRNIGIDFADEGYLWYGVQRTLSGEMAMLDFFGYDPGRYWWSAAWLFIVGSDGILATRTTTYIFAGLSFFLLFWTLSRQIRANWILLVASLVLVIWLYPRHKLFDIGVSVFLVSISIIYLERPSLLRHLLLGVTVGSAAVFGRNHGVYALFGAVLLVSANTFSQRPFRLTNWPVFGAGVVLGFSPMLIAMAALPEFGDFMVRSVAKQLGMTTTNLKLPIPWPWSIDLSGTETRKTLQLLASGIVFLAFPLVAVIGMFLYVKNRGRLSSNTVLFAAIAYLPGYAHHAFSRSDVAHLCQGAFPLLIASTAIASKLWSRNNSATAVALMIAMVAFAYTIPWDAQPISRYLRDTDSMVSVSVGHEELFANKQKAELYSYVEALVQSRLAEGHTFYAAPYWPGLYAAFRVRAPVRSIYPLWRNSEAYELREIERFERSNVSFALISLRELDALPERRFDRTNPLLYDYVNRNFRQVLNGPLEHDGLIEVYLAN
jgi:hypothetical protein